MDGPPGETLWIDSVQNTVVAVRTGSNDRGQGNRDMHAGAAGPVTAITAAARGTAMTGMLRRRVRQARQVIH